jgi:hypothetical protein
MPSVITETSVFGPVRSSKRVLMPMIAPPPLSRPGLSWPLPLPLPLRVPLPLRRDRHAQFFGDTCGDASGGDPSRLGVGDGASDAAPGLEAHLRKLRTLARTGVAAEDKHAMLAEGRDDLLPPLGDGEFLGIARRRHRGRPVRPLRCGP